MNAQITISSVAIALSFGSSPAIAQSSAARQPIRQHMTCSEFLRVDDLAKPEIVYWLATRSGGGTGAAVVDADTTDRMVPTLVERCKDAPNALLLQQLKAETEKLRRRL
jgi:acid stress chaperone HdeA